MALPPAGAQSDGYAGISVAQQREYFDRRYDADYNLLNGTSFTNRYPNARGHPYFGEDQYRQGSLVVNEVEYKDVLIKYDLYGQRIVLYHISDLGKTSQIVLHSEFIEEFSLDGKYFRKVSFEDTGKHFYQLIDAGPLKCLYRFDKGQVHDNSSLAVQYQFSNQIRKSFLWMNGQYTQFKSRRSFAGIFPGVRKKEILKYLRKSKIHFNRITDTGMEALLTYCITFMEQDR